MKITTIIQQSIWTLLSL